MTQLKNANLFCPKCGAVVAYNEGKVTGVKAGGVSAGAALGAKFGAGIGLAGGPLGAMAGTIPGALIGAVAGYIGGKKLSNPKCQRCGTKFSV